MTAEEKLLEAIKDADGRGLERIDSPNWQNDRFEWESHIPHPVRDAWDDLSPDARLVAYVCSLGILSSIDID